ncbi:uncharacterized protein LOC119693640 [Plutella xylostella]|uniref:uncharacterized protein LOC119693640 n=1 Tax=Plutella xylostella TaxID=51655 RepID=UPI0020329E46|nr:uncharacterized protein LOC119693640 [Plutella xylostella]
MASLKLLFVLLLQLVFVLALPADNNHVEIVNPLDNSKLSTTPALLVHMGADGAAPGAFAEGAAALGGCTNALCAQICRALGWGGGYCLSSTDCLCYR